MAATDVHVRSYGQLQQRLRALDYTETMGIESVALVSRLLTDVLEGTDAREKLQRQLQILQREHVEMAQTLLPLRKENAKLTRENNSVRTMFPMDRK